jgi:thioesterase domain-containing protein
MGHLEKHFDQELPATLLWNFRTVGELAEHLAGQRSKDPSINHAPPAPSVSGRPKAGPDNGQYTWRYLLPMQPTGSRTPLFFVHGALGFVASHVSTDQPLYALRPHGYDRRRAPKTLKEMARRYLREIRSVQPQGPYRIGGYPAGCVIAFEMARQLLAADEAVEVLILLDPQSIGKRFATRLDSDPSMSFAGRRRRQNIFERTVVRSKRISMRIIAQTSLSLYGKVPRFLREFHHVSTSRRVIRQFAPLPYPGCVKIFRTVDLESIGDPTMGCGQFVTGDIETIDVGGGNHDMLSATHAPDLARKLQECLDTIEQQCE